MKLHCDTCLNEILEMISQAVDRTDLEEIEWHLRNDLMEQDVLLLIVLTDIELTINFSEVVLTEAVRFIMSFGSELKH